MQLDDSTQVADGEGGTEARATAFNPKALLPFLKKIPTKRVVHLPNITTGLWPQRPLPDGALGNLPAGLPSAPSAHFRLLQHASYLQTLPVPGRTCNRSAVLCSKFPWHNGPPVAVAGGLSFHEPSRVPAWETISLQTVLHPDLCHFLLHSLPAALQ